MANITLPVTVIMPEEQARKLAPNATEISCTICDTCYCLVPLWLYVTHNREVHNVR